jgi:hypothetical protein
MHCNIVNLYICEYILQNSFFTGKSEGGQIRKIRSEPKYLVVETILSWPICSFYDFGRDFPFLSNIQLINSCSNIKPRELLLEHETSLSSFKHEPHQHLSDHLTHQPCLNVKLVSTYQAYNSSTFVWTCNLFILFEHEIHQFCLDIKLVNSCLDMNLIYII